MSWITHNNSLGWPGNALESFRMSLWIFIFVKVYTSILSVYAILIIPHSKQQKATVTFSFEGLFSTIIILKQASSPFMLPLKINFHFLWCYFSTNRSPYDTLGPLFQSSHHCLHWLLSWETGERLEMAFGIFVRLSTDLMSLHTDCKIQHFAKLVTVFTSAYTTSAINKYRLYIKDGSTHHDITPWFVKSNFKALI